MKTWEEIRDEVAEMLANGQPLENIISKLEQYKNETEKAEHKKQKPLTEEEWFCNLPTKEKAKVLDSIEYFARECENRHEYSCDNCDCPYCYNYEMDYEKWLKEKRNENSREL